MINKVSVIVSIYNVEQYLEKCVESIINQTLKEIQIILVDDGSTDKSSQICDYFKLKDNRIEVLHKKNGGLSSARNEGFKRVNAPYVIFVDSDDYLSENALEVLYNKSNINKLDILTAKVNTETEEGLYKDIYSFNENIQYEKIYTGKELISETKYIDILPMIWLNLYDTTFLKKHNLKFEEGVYHEDSEFTPRAIYLSDRIMFVDFIHYHQILSNNSIIRSKNIKKCFDLLLVSKSLNDFIDSKVKEKEIKDYLQNYSDYLIKASVDSALKQGILDYDFIYKERVKEYIYNRLVSSKKYKIIGYLIKTHLIFLYKMILKIK